MEVPPVRAPSFPLQPNRRRNPMDPILGGREGAASWCVLLGQFSLYAFHAGRTHISVHSFRDLIQSTGTHTERARPHSRVPAGRQLLGRSAVRATPRRILPCCPLYAISFRKRPCRHPPKHPSVPSCMGDSTAQLERSSTVLRATSRNVPTIARQSYAYELFLFCLILN